MALKKFTIKVHMIPQIIIETNENWDDAISNAKNKVCNAINHTILLCESKEEEIN